MTRIVAALLFTGAPGGASLAVAALARDDRPLHQRVRTARYWSFPAARCLSMSGLEGHAGGLGDLGDVISFLLCD
jgi:hypothetical protein